MMKSAIAVALLLAGAAAAARRAARTRTARATAPPTAKGAPATAPTRASEGTRARAMTGWPRCPGPNDRPLHRTGPAAMAEPRAGIAGPTGRLYPDTTASIAILTDQLPTMNRRSSSSRRATTWAPRSSSWPSRRRCARSIRAFSCCTITSRCGNRRRRPSSFSLTRAAWGARLLGERLPHGDDARGLVLAQRQHQRVASTVDQKLLMNVSVPTSSSTGSNRSRTR